MRNMNCELIGPRKLEYYINNPYSYIIDIRSKEMYDSGHIKGAENYPYACIIWVYCEITGWWNKRI